MRIKERTRPASVPGPTSLLRSPRARIGGLLGLGIVVIAAALSASTTEVGEENDVSTWLSTVVRKQRARWVADPERLVIDLKHKDRQWIRFSRDQAVRDRINLPGPDDYVPARIRHDGETLQARMRLKGIYPDHWNDDRKWSYQIKLKGDRTLFGMDRFSIQHPKNRDYIYEWLFLRALEDEGLIALRFRFVDVVINGEDYGIYSLVEHFGRRVLENNHRRVGPIIGFNKDLMLAEYARRNREGVGAYNTKGAFLAAYIDGIQTRGIEEGSPEEELYLKATTLLEAFRTRRLAASQVFDVEKMARALALKALFAAREFDWRDLKFYYDPIASRLEPIVAEVHSSPHPRIPGWWLNDGDREFRESFTRLLFADEDLFRAYLTELSRMTEPPYLEALFKRHQSELVENLTILATEFPKYEFTPETLMSIQKQVRAILNPQNALHAYYSHRDERGVILELGNIQHLPLEIVAVETADGRRLSPEEPTVLAGKRAVELVDYDAVAFAVPEGMGRLDRNLSLVFRVLGSEEERRTRVFPWPHLREDFLEKDPIRSATDLREVEFLDVNEDLKEIRLLPGRAVLRHALTIPPGYTVRAFGGTELLLAEEGLILSYSPFRFEGSPDEPIRIEADGGPGQGIVLLKTAEESVFKYVSFRGLAAPSRSGWSLTGALTFYEADVRFEGCTFESNQTGDDLVNIVRSRFSITDSRFVDSRADALDVDFSEGQIERTLFARSGNDAIDTSGSRVRIRDVAIHGAGDKGLSFGEESRIEAERVLIRGARLGIASKDRSTARLMDVEITQSGTGVAVYQKKPQFGPAQLTLHGLRMRAVEEPWIVEERSVLLLDGERVASTDTRVSNDNFARTSPMTTLQGRPQ